MFLEGWSLSELELRVFGSFLNVGPRQRWNFGWSPVGPCDGWNFKFLDVFGRLVPVRAGASSFKQVPKWF